MMLEPGGNFRMLQDAGPTAYLDGLPAELLPQGGAIVKGAMASTTYESSCIRRTS